MADNSRITSDQVSPASTIRNSRPPSQRLVSNSYLQRPVSVASVDGNPQGLRHVSSRFSLNENFAASRREYTFDEGDDYSISDSIRFGEGEQTIDDETFTEDTGGDDHGRELYTILGLSFEQGPSSRQIETAYEWHSASLELNNDGNQTPELQEAFGKHRARLQYAYETLKHPQRRVIYDLSGEAGLREAYAPGGIMCSGGYAKRAFVDVDSMNAEEFRQWWHHLKRKDLHIPSGNRGSWVIGPYSGTLAVHQTFGVPLRSLRQLFVSRIVTTECERNVNRSPILTVGGGFSALHHRNFRFTQFLPSCSLRLDHTFSRSTTGDNRLSGDTSASICSGVALLDHARPFYWPQQWYSFGLRKNVHILDCTRPFYCSIEIVSWSTETPRSPAITLMVERAITDNASFYYQFRSEGSSSLWRLVNPIIPFGPTTEVGCWWTGPKLDSKSPERSKGNTREKLHTDGRSWQIGFGIAANSNITGTKLFVTCFLQRFGQGIHLPILLIPDDLLENTWALFALGVSCTLCLVEFGIIRPWRRRQSLANKEHK